MRGIVPLIPCDWDNMEAKTFNQEAEGGETGSVMNKMNEPREERESSQVRLKGQGGGFQWTCVFGSAAGALGGGRTRQISVLANAACSLAVYKHLKMSRTHVGLTVVLSHFPVAKAKKE